MQKINLYAPVDGVINKIEKISDDVFAQKMLGDGFFIVPESNEFHSFFENSQIEMIFDTKHALHIKDLESGCVGLIHIGLDTVSLNGEPFNIKVKEKSKVTIKDVLVDVDLELIKSKNISTETAIVFETTQFNNLTIKLNKTGKVKAGDLIGEINFEKETTKVSSKTLGTFENQYLKTAKEIYQYVGKKDNVKDFYNCMTRLRIVIGDKTKVNEDSLKKLGLVKGLNWNGQELQIIIGGEVYKVKEEFETVMAGTAQNTVAKVKIPFYKKILPTITGIMQPSIPALLTIGIIGALYNILLLANVVQPVPESGNLGEIDMFSGVLYILSKVGLNLIGIIFIYTTVRFLKGNTIMAIFIGYSLVSHLFFFGGGNGWPLFTIGSQEIYVKNYVDSMLPFIIAGFIYFYFDKWVKTWMPTSVDVVFRHTLTYLFTITLTLFVVGPIFGTIEQLMALLFINFEAIPLGIGVAIFAFIWQPLVLTGTHLAIAVALGTPIQENGYSLLWFGIFLGTFGQLGAALGSALRTNNSQIKQVVYGAAPAAIFGITEPLIYGVTLPRLKPFLFGCVSAAIGALFIVNTGARVLESGYMTLGIITILNIGPTGIYTVWATIGLLITIGSAIALTWAFDIDRINEYKGALATVKKIASRYATILNLKSKEEKQKIIKRFDTNLNDLKENNKLFKEFEKFSVKLQKLNITLEKINKTEEKHKYKLYKNALKNEGTEKFELLVENYNNFNLDLKKQPLIEQKNLLITEMEAIKKQIISLQEKTMKDTSKVLDELAKETKFDEMKNYADLFYNSVYSINIFFGELDKKEFKINNKEFKQFLVERG
ncbi:glucose PTS transporter subunit IIA [Spiroplasma culicicola]|uniref:PTS system beta-glucoside-specific IIABC component n=1 Tax=Spiroplasma culicicola AES-1 TaxID=1276246 RepID=W6A711_9MOLU|nr:glucose PTS transporter subunit IIA [Spiroplasma culicicola]AHI52751.1 PTS system beta-glucoside-specific IIABC component [Spiroplasma culicicola AES-1]